MTVQEVIDQAISGELSQLGVAKNYRSTDSAVKLDAVNKIIQYLNLGLIELYKRFSLASGEAVIVMVEGQTVYNLPADCNAVLSAYDEAGNELPINSEGEAYSIMTPTYDTVQIVGYAAGEAIYVMYSKTAPLISTLDEMVDLSTVAVKLPYSLLEALLHYIGYRGHGAVDGSIQAENNTHYMRFEKSCANVQKYGNIQQDFVTDTSWLRDKGFV